MNATKRCARCGDDKPIEQFGKRKASPDGLHYYCKQCRNGDAKAARQTPEGKAYAAERRAKPEQREKARNRTAGWREENRERDRDNAKRWAAEHPEERAEYVQNYKADPENAAKIAAYHAKRDRERAEEKAEYDAEYRIINADTLREKRKMFRAENWQLVRFRERINDWHRRSRTRASSTARFTQDKLAAKVAYWGNRCWVCHGPWSAIDHYKPLVAGGAHMLCNFRPICTRCNSAKGGKWPVPPREVLLRWRRRIDATRLVR